MSRGLVEEVIAQVGRQSRGRIAVIARLSSMRFAGNHQGVCDVGASLQAAYVLDGSVRRQEDRVRITAWLVETDGETDVWSDTYGRRANDSLSKKVEVGARIAAALVDALVI